MSEFNILYTNAKIQPQPRYIAYYKSQKMIASYDYRHLLSRSKTLDGIGMHELWNELQLISLFSGSFSLAFHKNFV